MKERSRQSNLPIRSVISTLKIVIELMNEKSKILAYQKDIFDNIEHAERKIASQEDWVDIWLMLKKNINSHKEFIQDLLNKLFEKIQNKDLNKIKLFWLQYKSHISAMGIRIKEMKNMGDVIFTGKDVDEWVVFWKKIGRTHSKLIDSTETLYVKLGMVEGLKQGELEELAKGIMNYSRYCLEEIELYEKEYIEAYNEIKEDTVKRKNLWNKFLYLMNGKEKETLELMKELKWMGGREHK